MRKIQLCDISIRRANEFTGGRLPFRIKIEVAKQLSNLGVSIIETNPIVDGKTDYYLIKSIASTVRNSIVSVPVNILDKNSPEKTWEALKEAPRARMQVPAPVSTVQMEYFCHKKPESMLKLIHDNVERCRALCSDVEFLADDFGRCDREFLSQAIKTAVEAGASIVTVSDAAGDFLPEEFYESIKSIREELPSEVALGVYCSNDMYLADSCAVSAVRAGADEVKTMAFGNSTVSLKRFPKIVNNSSHKTGIQCNIEMTGLEHGMERILKLCEVCLSKSPTAVGARKDDDDGIRLSIHDSKEAVLEAVYRLGYELNEEDCNKVYDTFTRLYSDESVVGSKEIDAIVASVAFQAPATYVLESFVINTGNILTPSCHIRIKKDGKIMESVCLGDGPVDAAFVAIDKVVGKHYELDDFQVRSVTEGREAMGETVVRLRHDGIVFSGRGVSKDIVGSSVMAYLNAINKIAYEEEQV